MISPAYSCRSFSSPTAKLCGSGWHPVSQHSARSDEVAIFGSDEVALQVNSLLGSLFPTSKIEPDTDAVPKRWHFRPFCHVCSAPHFRASQS